MRIILYYIALLLFILSAGVLIFTKPMDQQTLDFSIGLAKAGVSILGVNALVDFVKHLLRIGEYKTLAK